MNDVELESKSKHAELAEKAGIIERRRFIHIFYDPKKPSSCKVIQINVSVTKGSNVLFDEFFMNRHNGTLSFVAVYIYDCQLNTVGKSLKEQFEHGSLTLLSAKRLDRETDYDSGITRNETAPLYSKTFSNYTMSDYVESRVLVNPMYYTQEHEYYSTGEYNERGMMDDIYLPNLIGMDIIDDVTVIIQQKPHLYETIRDTLMLGVGGTNEILEKYAPRELSYKDAASDSITTINFILGCDSMVNGGVFIYDSQMGMKFDNKVAILCKKYIAKEQVVNELDSFITTMEAVCKGIEKHHGSIRMMYAPSLIGSKCRIIYKDMENKTSDCGINNSESSKDSSYEITEVIGENLDSESGSMFRNRYIDEEINYGEFEKEKLISGYYDF